MDVQDVPDALQERLGPAATAALLQLFVDTRKDCATEVINIVGDRFERRLVEKTFPSCVLTWRRVLPPCAGRSRHCRQELRQEIAAGNSALRQEMADQRLRHLEVGVSFLGGAVLRRRQPDRCFSSASCARLPDAGAGNQLRQRQACTSLDCHAARSSVSSTLSNETSGFNLRPSPFTSRTSP